MGVRRVRRYSTEFKLQLVEACLASEGAAKGLAAQHGISHSLVLLWADKYRRGELTLTCSARSTFKRRTPRSRPWSGWWAN